MSKEKLVLGLNGKGIFKVCYMLLMGGLAIGFGTWFYPYAADSIDFIDGMKKFSMPTKGSNEYISTQLIITTVLSLVLYKVGVYQIKTNIFKWKRRKKKPTKTSTTEQVTTENVKMRF